MEALKGGGVKRRFFCDCCENPGGRRRICYIDLFGREVPALVIEHVHRVIVAAGERGITDHEAFGRGQFFGGVSVKNRRAAVATLEAAGRIARRNVSTGLSGRPRLAWVAHP